MDRALESVPRDFSKHRRPSVPDATTLAAISLVISLLLTICGCGIVPKSRMDECQRLTQTLRSENARLKDRVLALQGQNRDYADRAIDDARRLSTQDEAIERLEHSVQAYQDERTRLEAAYNQLTANLSAPELSKNDPQRGAVSTLSPTKRSAATTPPPAANAAASMHSDEAPR